MRGPAAEQEAGGRARGAACSLDGVQQVQDEAGEQWAAGCRDSWGAKSRLENVHAPVRGPFMWDRSQAKPRLDNVTPDFVLPGTDRSTRRHQRPCTPERFSKVLFRFCRLARYTSESMWRMGTALFERRVAVWQGSSRLGRLSWGMLAVKSTKCIDSIYTFGAALCSELVSQLLSTS